MKVLFPYVGDTLGGSHISSLLLVAELLKSSTNIEPVVVLHETGALEDYLKKLGISYAFTPPIIKIVGSSPIFSQVLGMAKSGFLLKKYLKENNVDIVHTNDQRMHLTWLLACRFAGCKHVWHQRNICKSRRRGFYSSISNVVLTISHFCKKSLPSSMSNRARVIQNPINFSSVDEESKLTAKREFCRELDFLTSVLIVSWVANWMPRKRPLDFIKLAKLLVVRGHTNIRFFMFGEPRKPIIDEVERAIRDSGLDKYLFIMGSRMPIEPYIAGSDLLIATAENEGLGRTLIEAMALKTPVVASDSGGHSEIIENGVDGFLVPLGDVERMADRVEDILSLRSKEMVEIARIRAEKRFSVSTHVESVINIYKSL